MCVAGLVPYEAGFDDGTAFRGSNVLGYCLDAALLFVNARELLYRKARRASALWQASTRAHVRLRVLRHVRLLPRHVLAHGRRSRPVHGGTTVPIHLAARERRSVSLVVSLQERFLSERA